MSTAPRGRPSPCPSTPRRSAPCGGSTSAPSSRRRRNTRRSTFGWTRRRSIRSALAATPDRLGVARRPHAGELAQLLELVGRQAAPLAARQRLGGERPVPDAHEPRDLVADRFHHAVDLTVAAFGDDELDPGVLAALG